MLSRATVRRKTGATTGATNGMQVAVWETIYADLPTRVVGRTTAAPARHKSQTGDGVNVSVSDRGLDFPAATSDLRDGDLVEITAGELTGAVFEITEAGWQDQATARRVPAVETTRPQEW